MGCLPKPHLPRFAIIIFHLLDELPYPAVAGVDPGFFTGRGPTPGMDPEVWVRGRTMCRLKVSTHARHCRGLGGLPPEKCLNLDALRCDFRQILMV
jgi:hypothetical protein